MKQVFSSIIIFLFISTSVLSANATTIKECKEDVVSALYTVMGVPGSEILSGYLKQLSDLTSTNMPTHALIDEVQQLGRDAQIELSGICREVERFEELNPFYVAAYSLQGCKDLTIGAEETGEKLSVISLCNSRSQDLLDTFLESLQQYLLKQAIRTSVEPLIQRLQSLNARLVVLLSEYGRVINNFFTFSFRLGDTITGERD